MYTEGVSERSCDVFRLSDFGKADEPHPVERHVAVTACDLEREPGLADSTGANEGHDWGIGQSGGDCGDEAVAADQSIRWPWQFIVSLGGDS